MLIAISSSALCMQNKNITDKKIDFKEQYNRYHLQAKELLTKEARQAIEPNCYRESRDNGVKALNLLAKHTVALAYQDRFSKTLSERKLTKKSAAYAQYMVDMTDNVLGLKSYEVTDESTAAIYVISRLSHEERVFLRKEEYRANTQKAHSAIAHFANLTAQELITRDLLKEPQEEFERRFIQEKIGTLNTLWLSK